eukprot:TRINITY_DN28156_c0_g1_i1.p1 TRINITY_DN28156_c0_g1~~TRINITY_DN28156_c0_g1_i1.p1  ORF type:complete len:183 (-),score=67.86 TRINITY_DN28156_c0_g1_i1:26-553(-)
MDDSEAEKDTAYLIEKTDQQTFVSVMVGVVMTGLVYTGLLILKPGQDCKMEKEGEERDLAWLDRDYTPGDHLTARTASLTGMSLLCAGLSSPFISSVMIVWVPIVLYTVITGFMVREVELLDRSDDAEEDVDIGNITEEDTAQASMQFSTNEKLNAPTLSRYSLYNSEGFYNLGF